MEQIDPYQDWQEYARMCEDDPYEDIIDDSLEPEARRILAEINRRKKERMTNGTVVWIEEGF